MHTFYLEIQRKVDTSTCNTPLVFHFLLEIEITEKEIEFTFPTTRVFYDELAAGKRAGEGKGREGKGSKVDGNGEGGDEENEEEVRGREDEGGEEEREEEGIRRERGGE